MLLIFSILVVYILWVSQTRDYPKDDFLSTLRRLLNDYRETFKAFGKLFRELPVMLLSVFLGPFAKRLVVSDRIVNRAVSYLKSELKNNRGFEQADQIPDSVYLSIVHEALRRAGEKEKDGRARSGQFLNEVDATADSVVAAFAGAENADPRIKNILVFNRVL